ncbi:MAG: PAS domain S-box protein [Candidatus Thiodiazotropha sp. (ex Semelilucina semeliformis)]|nr:PAS domain S-box protein [Candidatus Thiodiazotropha sp. (ex Myrtea spinifera)]MCU7808261.1 PAS domain S-box protein [Candidatus Thiodiazotropha sp. (ex Semelilucina semeliformis)]MCU7830566.1 PAS domain S-box protein [Candidatus Thiodiazotropha sp. (ex Myrtea sp. 'scaly one' KF741663)]
MRGITTSLQQSWLARIPLPWISVVVGLLCGLVTWLFLDPILNQRLEKIFQDNLASRLEVRSIETRHRFESFLQEWSSLGHRFAQHWQVVDHLSSSAWEDSLESPIRYNRRRPPAWIESGQLILSSIEPDQVVLLDSDGGPREIFQSEALPFPLERLTDFFSGREEVVMTTIQRKPYLLVWSGIRRTEGFDPAFLMLVVEIDDHFLDESQQAVGDPDTVIALLDSENQELIVSSNRKSVFTTSPLGIWKEAYLVTSQALVGYQGVDQNLLFTTLVSREATMRTMQNILSLAQQDRFIAALVFMAAFSLVFFLISTKISHVLQRISRFGQQALGIEQPVVKRGNQMLLLESWIKAFFRQVIVARDKLRLQQEERLKESEVFKSALFDNSMDAIITLDEQGQVIEVNGTAVRAFGFDREKLLGGRFDEIAIHPDYRAKYRHMLSSCARKSGSNLECRAQSMVAVTGHGEERAIECSVISIHLSQQTVFNVYLRDVTGRKQAEREIASLAKLASENPNPVLRANKRGVIVYANTASKPLLDYWGCERGQTLPRYWQNLVNRSLTAGETEEFEVSFDGQVFSLQLAPIQELDYVNLYARDITQMRNAEMQSRQHQSELVHVCRVSTMGEMSTGLAHELNQPLSAIINFASGCVRRIQSGVGGEAELVDAMAQITVQAERAGEIIKRLRALVGKRPQEHEVVNLNHMVLEVASFIEYEANRHRVEVTLELSKESLPVKVDLVQIEQVLLNLVRNAIDAMKVVTSGDRKLLLKTKRLDDSRVEAIVMDNGPGMAPDTCEHLFDAFFSTKETGMGMGLPISKKIIEAHYGELSVETSVGEGAIFHVVIPTDPALELPGF